MAKQDVTGRVAIPGGLPATRNYHGNSTRVGKSCPTARQWVTGAVGKSQCRLIPEEVYWLHDDSPRSLRRRADDIERDGLFAFAVEMRKRADQVERNRLDAAIRVLNGETDG